MPSVCKCDGYEVKFGIQIGRDEVMFATKPEDGHHPYAVVLAEHRRGSDKPFVYVSTMTHRYEEAIYFFAREVESKAMTLLKEQAPNRQQEMGGPTL